MIADLTQTGLESSPNTSKPRSRKITWQDAEAIATLVAKRLTEAEACLSIGILKPNQWFQWKQRQKREPRFEQLVTRLRGNKLNACIDAIDEAGNAYECESKNGTVYTRPGDWRAKAWLAERVLAPERLGQQQGSTTTNQTVIIGQLGGDDALKRILDTVYSAPKAKEIVDVESVKEI